MFSLASGMPHPGRVSPKNAAGMVWVVDCENGSRTPEMTQISGGDVNLGNVKCRRCPCDGKPEDRKGRSIGFEVLTIL